MDIGGIPINTLRAAAQNAQTFEQREKVKNEFMAIFYKEMLKQVFDSPKFGLDEDQASFMNTYGSDMLVEKMAMQLAQSKSFSAGDLFPAVESQEGK